MPASPGSLHFLHKSVTGLSHAKRISAAFSGYTDTIKRRAGLPSRDPIEQDSSLSLPPSILVRTALLPRGGFDLYAKEPPKRFLIRNKYHSRVADAHAKAVKKEQL